MLRMVDKEYIRKKHYVEGWSVRRISRNCEIARQTVRKCLADANPPRYTLSKPRPATVMGKWIPVIEQWLKDDEAQPRKQRHTAKRVYDRLIGEFPGEFCGAESTVRRVVRQLRDRIRVPEVFVPLTAVPGNLAQVDFQESYVEIDGARTKVYLFCLALRHSGVRFAFAFRHGRTEDLLAGLVQAFEWLEGVPQRVRLDNTRAAVKAFLPGNRREENDLFSSLRAHYLFDSEFCNVRKAHEKGAVENLCGFVRRNALVPMPRVRDIEELNRHLLDWCENDRKKHPEWQTERVALRPLPRDRFKPCVTRLAVVSKQSLVTFDRNRYSVPSSLVGQTVRLEIYSERIEIHHKDKLVASHKRLQGRGGTSADFEHYRTVVTYKRRAAMDGAFVSTMPAIYQKAREMMLSQKLGYKEFAAILGLTAGWPQEAIEAALAKAIEMDRLTAQTVLQLLLAAMPAHQTLTKVPPGLAVSLTSPDLSVYDRLAKGAANS